MQFYEMQIPGFGIGTKSIIVIAESIDDATEKFQQILAENRMITKHISEDIQLPINARNGILISRGFMNIDDVQGV